MRDRVAHVAATYRLLLAACRSPAQTPSAGRDFHAWREARLLRWLLLPDREAASTTGIIVGVADELPGREFPGDIPSPLGRERIPLRFVRSPACIGNSGGLAYPVRNVTCDLGPGSVGAFARDPAGTGYFALTAAHVAAGAASASISDVIEISGRQRAIQGRLANWNPVMGFAGFSTRIDSAVVSLDPLDVQELIADTSMLPLGIADPGQLDTTVFLQRANVSPLAGTFRGWWSGWVNARVSMDGGDYWLEDGVAYDLVSPFSRGGDSGAGVWDSQDRLVAFHCGHAPDNDNGWNGVGCSAQDVFTHFGLTPVLRTSSVTASRTVRAPDPTTPPSVAAVATANEVDVLARTMWGEARGERDPAKSMSAVAAVVLNRVLRKGWWGRTITEVCLKPWQFSCWNRNDPNLPKLQRVTAVDDHRFELALSIAALAAGGQLVDPTGGATHYYSRTLVRPPNWAIGKTPCCMIDRHFFFNDIS